MNPVSVTFAAASNTEQMSCIGAFAGWPERSETLPQAARCLSERDKSPHQQADQAGFLARDLNGLGRGNGGMRCQGQGTIVRFNVALKKHPANANQVDEPIPPKFMVIKDVLRERHFKVSEAQGLAACV